MDNSYISKFEEIYNIKNSTSGFDDKNNFSYKYGKNALGIIHKIDDIYYIIEVQSDIICFSIRGPLNQNFIFKNNYVINSKYNSIIIFIISQMETSNYGVELKSKIKNIKNISDVEEFIKEIKYSNKILNKYKIEEMHMNKDIYEYFDVNLPLKEGVKYKEINYENGKMFIYFPQNGFFINIFSKNNLYSIVSHNEKISMFLMKSSIEDNPFIFKFDKEIKFFNFYEHKKMLFEEQSFNKIMDKVESELIFG